MRCVFSLLLKMSTDSDSWIDLGSLFHKWGAAEANALSPHVRLDFGMAKENSPDDRRPERDGL